MTARLDAQRKRLLLQFYNMETAVGKLQSNLTVIDSIQLHRRRSRRRQFKLTAD